MKVGASVELRHLAPEEAILSHATIHHFPTHHLPLTTYNLQLTLTILRSKMPSSCRRPAMMTAATSSGTRKRIHPSSRAMSDALVLKVVYVSRWAGR